jgi:hypothetical protein
MPAHWPCSPLRRYLFLVLLTAVAASAAEPRASYAVPYALVTPPSSLNVGCQGPCECPIVTTPTYGSFELVYTGSDPLYAHYDVQRYIASFNNGPGAVAIVGAGKYEIGGEFALVQQLTLDLQIEGRPVQHFDSGLVPVGAQFPRLSVSCAVHGFDCFDSVLVVDAKPVDFAGSPEPTRPAGLQSVWPNPFSGQARIVFALDRPGEVTLAIVDLEGRRIRELAAGDLAGAGPGTRIWDGRRDDGRPAPAGVYWVRLRWPGGMDQRSVIKLE